MNKGLHLNWNRRSTGTALRNGSPVQPKALSVPADDGVGLDDDQDLFPSRPELRKKDPERAIDWIDLGNANARAHDIVAVVDSDILTEETCVFLRNDPVPIRSPKTREEIMEAILSVERII